jgi:uncharacterized protein (DUF2236 family)
MAQAQRKDNKSPLDTTLDTDLGYFGPGSVTWRIGKEYVMLLGGGRAVLMQLAHPLVATGVARHSSFLRDPWERTRRTVEFTQVMTFGTYADAHAMARTVNRLHRDVAGTLDRPLGSFAAGTRYQAQYPELLLWVFATLVDTGLTLYPLLVGPLNEAERKSYYQESKRTTVLLGLPSDMMPDTLADFEAYMRAMLTGPTLSVTPEARVLARRVLRLRLPKPAVPLQMATEQLTIGLLPPRVRALYGYAWDARREALMQAWAASTRRLLPLVPPRVRYTPWARQAFQRCFSHAQHSSR